VAQAHTAVAADDNGDRIFVGDSDGKLTVRRLNPSELERTLDIGDPGGVGALAVTPEGSEIFVLGAGDGVVGIVEPDGGDRGAFETGGQKVRSMALTPDGATLVTGDDSGTVALWNRAARSVRGKVHGHDDAVCSVAVSGDSRLAVSAGRDGTVRSWNAMTGEARAAAPRPQGD
jgi:WD40 repeat protein